MRFEFFSVSLPEVDITYPVKAIAASIATLFTLENFPSSLKNFIPMYFDGDISNVLPQKNEDNLDLHKIK